MSVLSGHSKALKALAEALAYVGNECGDGHNGLLLCRLSEASSRAAASLDEQMRQATAEEPAPTGK